MITRLANEIFNDYDLVALWMRTPNKSLGNFAPLDLLETEPGANSVRLVLNAIQAGGLIKTLRLRRITNQKWALDKSREGTRLYGGRWNLIGSSAFLNFSEEAH